MFQSCLCVTLDGILPIVKETHPSFENLAIISTPCLQAFLMDIHHDTSLRSILEDDSSSLASKARIHFCLVRGARLWLVIRPFIRSFCITHFFFLLCFHLGLIQPLTSGIFMCECGHGLNAFGTHIVCCPFGGQQIATPLETSCMPPLERMGMLYGESDNTALCQEFHYEPIFT